MLYMCNSACKGIILLNPTVATVHNEQCGKVARGASLLGFVICTISPAPMQVLYMLQFNVQRSNFIESYGTVHNEQGWNVRMHPCQVLYGTVHFSRETAQATESSKIVSLYLSEFLRYRKLSGTHPLLVCGHRKLCFLTLQTKQLFLLNQSKKYALPLNLIWNVHKNVFFSPKSGKYFIYQA